MTNDSIVSLSSQSLDNSTASRESDLLWQFYIGAWYYSNLTPYSHKQVARRTVHMAVSRVNIWVVPRPNVNGRYRSDSQLAVVVVYFLGSLFSYLVKRMTPTKIVEKRTSLILQRFL